MFKVNNKDTSTTPGEVIQVNLHVLLTFVDKIFPDVNIMGMFCQSFGKEYS